MSVTLNCDGTFQGKIKSVGPEDVVLRGKALSVKGVILPISPSHLYETFRVLERYTRYKHGTLYFKFLKSGDISYAVDASDDTADYYIGRVLGFGSNYPSVWTRIFASSYSPDDDEYKVGSRY